MHRDREQGCDVSNTSPFDPGRTSSMYLFTQAYMQDTNTHKPPKRNCCQVSKLKFNVPTFLLPSCFHSSFVGLFVCVCVSDRAKEADFDSQIAHLRILTPFLSSVCVCAWVCTCWCVWVDEFVFWRRTSWSIWTSHHTTKATHTYTGTFVSIAHVIVEIMPFFFLPPP